MGAFTALAPQFMARLILFPALLLLVLFALLSYSNHDLKELTLKYWIAILLATMALWPTYMILKVGGLPSLDARRIIAGLTLAGMIYLILSRKPIRERLNNLTVGPLKVGFILISAYVLLRVASCFMSVAPVYSLMQVFWESLYYYTMFFVGAMLFDRQYLQHWVVKVILTLSFLIFIYTLIERAISQNLLVAFAPSNDEFLMLKKALAAGRERGGSYRVQGTFEHPLLLAEFAAITASFSLSSLLWGSKSFLIRCMSIGMLILCVIVAILTGSRSAFISLGVVVAILTLVKFFSVKDSKNANNTFMRKLFFFTTLLAIFVISLPVLYLLVSGSNADEIGSTNARLMMLELGWDSIKSNFLLGIGPGTAGSVAGLRNASGVGTLDNYFLAIAIESGIPAVLLLVLCFIYPAYKAFNLLMRNGGELNKVFVGSLLGTMLVLVVVHTIVWMPYNFFFGFLFSGMFLGMQSHLIRKA